MPVPLKPCFDIQWRIFKYTMSLICPASGKMLKMLFDAMIIKAITVVCVVHNFTYIFINIVQTSKKFCVQRANSKNNHTTFWICTYRQGFLDDSYCYKTLRNCLLVNWVKLLISINSKIKMLWFHVRMDYTVHYYRIYYNIIWWRAIIEGYVFLIFIHYHKKNLLNNGIFICL